MSVSASKASMHSLASGGISPWPAGPRSTSFTISENIIAPGRAIAVSGVRQPITAGAHADSSGEMDCPLISRSWSSPSSVARHSCSVLESWSNRSPQMIATEPTPGCMGVGWAAAPGDGTAVGAVGAGGGVTSITVAARVGLGAGVGASGALVGATVGGGSEAVAAGSGASRDAGGDAAIGAAVGGGAGCCGSATVCSCPQAITSPGSSSRTIRPDHKIQREGLSVE